MAAWQTYGAYKTIMGTAASCSLLMTKCTSVEVSEGPQRENEGKPRRNVIAKAHAWASPRGLDNVKTVYDLYKHGCEKFAGKNAMGSREFIRIHNESKEVTKKVDGEDKKVTKQWQYFELGSYNWITYKELDEQVAKLASGLVKLGVRPEADRFSIYSRTSEEWMQTFLACCSQSVTVVTAYDTLGVEGLTSSVNESETVGILTDKDNFKTLAKTLKQTPSIKLVVYRETDGPLSDAEKESIKAIEAADVKVVPFSEVLELGTKNPVEPTPPKPDDCACIMYTSGSTGKPKGVILNHSTVVAGVAGATGAVEPYVISTDVFLSILPLAHIFELTAELATFVWGSSLGYGTPKTASDTNMRNCVGDIRELRPTIMVAVPALWETVKKGIVAKIEQQGTITQKLFWAAFKLKHSCREAFHFTPPLVDTIFKRIKEGTGGRLRFVLNGGAALSRDTRVFLDTVVAPCLMGYGLTETNAMAALMNPGRVDFDTTGEITPAVTMKLRDVPEMGYYGSKGQGEVLLKGPCVTPGYFKNDEETKKAFDEDGWFCTGDIGEFAKGNGNVKIIDRVKNLVKTLNGEYVALERLEALYRSNKYVANICVFADSDHNKPVAVVVLNDNAVKAYCKQHSIEYNEHDHAHFAQNNKQVYNEILHSIQATGRECDMANVEILPAVTFSEDEWTPQNGFVTSAQKVQRKKIQEANKAGLEKAFSQT